MQWKKESRISFPKNIGSDDDDDVELDAVDTHIVIQCKKFFEGFAWKF